MDIPFAGARAASGPLTWGQRTTWEDFEHFKPEVMPFFFVRQAIPVPPGLTLDDVYAGIADLVARHEVLRTLFTAGPDGEPLQRVLDRGAVPARVFETADRPGGNLLDVLSEHMGAILQTPFRHESEVSLRAGIGLVQGVPVMLFLGMSRLAVDLQSAAIVAADLFALLDARAKGRPAPEQPVARQPLDQAAFERSGEGERLSGRALRRMRRDLLVAPATIFAAPVPMDRPRFWRGALESSAVPGALRILARRHNVALSGILFAVTTALLNAVTGAENCPVKVVYGNRSAPGLRHAVGSLSETVLICAPVGGETFGEHLERTGTAMMRAYVDGRFDTMAAEALAAEVSRERGVDLDLTCRFNDMWSWTLGEGESTDPPTPADVRAASRHTRFEWTEKTDLDKIMFFVDVNGTPSTVRIQALADTFRMPPGVLRDLLFGFERVLVELAERDLSMAEIPAIARLSDVCLGAARRHAVDA